MAHISPPLIVSVGEFVKAAPLSPYLFIVVLSALMHDFHHQFELIFRHRPWTYSAEYPLVDVEYADDTVLMARTQSTLHQLLHLLQHLASQRGLHINPDKCQLLRLNSNLPICLSHSTSPTSCCSCCFCCDFTTLTPTENSLADPLPVVDTAKYLGAMISANSSSNADVAYRYSQAATAFRCLFPCFHAPSDSPQKEALDLCPNRYGNLATWFRITSLYTSPDHKIELPSLQGPTPNSPNQKFILS